MLGQSQSYNGMRSALYTTGTWRATWRSVWACDRGRMETMLVGLACPAGLAGDALGPATAVAWQTTSRLRSDEPSGTAVPVCCHATAVTGISFGAMKSGSKVLFG